MDPNRYVFFIIDGVKWMKIIPPWIKGYRPWVTYRRVT
jgi:hypothetical protein